MGIGTYHGFSPRRAYEPYGTREANVDLVWTPRPEIVYPNSFTTCVEAKQITERLEDASRPNHFRGVTTVVAKLFNIFGPTRAYFGQKNTQQVAVIQHMVAI